MDQISSVINNDSSSQLFCIIFFYGHNYMLIVTFILFVIDRKLEGHETFFVILNVGTEQETIVLYDYFQQSIPTTMIVRVSSLNSWQAEK